MDGMLTKDFYLPAGDDLIAGLFWSTLEITTAFVISCIPATRLFLQHFSPVVGHYVSHALSTVTGSRTVAEKRGSSALAGKRPFSNKLPAKNQDITVSTEAQDLHENRTRNSSTTENNAYPV